jgi:F-box/TPR repeat protein Pof3
MIDYRLYDKRAAALEKLGVVKDALKDAQRSMKLKPDRWEPYARAARLFYSIEKLKPALSMLDLAEDRLSKLAPSVDSAMAKKRASVTAGLSLLRNQISDAVSKEKAKRTRCPIALLPLELLETTFAYLVLPEQRHAVVLSHVCRHWRDLVLNKPSFWHTLSVTCRDLKREKTKIHTWLLRCRYHLFALELDGCGSHCDPLLLVTCFAALNWSTLRRLSAREVSASVWSQLCRVFAQACGGRATGHLEQLELVWEKSQRHVSLILDVGRSSDDRSDYVPGDVISLSSVTLQGLRLDGLEGFHGALTILKVSDIHWGMSEQHIYDLLVCNPRLQELWVENCSPPLGLPSGKQPIAFRHLRDLRLSAPAGQSHPLDIFAAPVLETLLVSPAHRTDQALDSFMQRSGDIASLRELRLRKWSLGTSASLDNVLRACRELRTLELTDMSSGTNAIVVQLAKRTESHLACPRLKHIKLDSCLDVSTSAVIALVKARSYVPSQAAEASSALPSLSAPQQADPSPSQDISRLSMLILDGCPLIEAESLPWLRQQVKTFSCRYMTKKQATYKR